MRLPELTLRFLPSSQKYSKLLPLLIAIALVAAAAWVIYQIYLSVVKIRTSASERMGGKNVVFTKEGVKVGVRQIENESYVDVTQSWVVKAWNMAAPQDDEAVKKRH